MRVISRRTFREFWERHRKAEAPLRAWFAEAKRARWTRPADVKAMHRSASVIDDRRIVFNVKGTDYRLLVRVTWETEHRRGRIHIRFIGTHDEYNRLNTAEV